MYIFSLLFCFFPFINNKNSDLKISLIIQTIIIMCVCVYIEMIIIIIIISHAGQDTEVEVRRKKTFPLIRIVDSCEPIDSIWSDHGLVD